MSKLPIVCIVGRPNVGKSTLFNRILGRQSAVAAEVPGVTRDRKEEVCEWAGRLFTLVDTGGWETGRGEVLDELVARQVEVAVRHADVVLFVVDASAGILPGDREIADLLRKRATEGHAPNVIVVANKVDSETREAASYEAHALGLGEVVPVSALHGRNVGDLLDRIVGMLGDRAPALSVEEEEIPAVAIVGRPNVGKSTLFNQILSEERSIVSDVAGTTRDSIDSIVQTEHGRRYRFVDTAGLKKAGSYQSRVEYYSATRTYRAIDRADVVLLVADASLGVTEQDQSIARRALSAGCGIAVILNKWDLCDEETKERVLKEAASKLRFVDFAPVLRVSAATGRNVPKILPVIDEVLEAYSSRATTAKVNEVLQRVVAENPPPFESGLKRRPKLLYATQAARKPPTFVVFTGAKLPDSYVRYLENRFRKDLGIGPTPIKVKVVPRASRRR